MQYSTAEFVHMQQEKDELWSTFQVLFEDVCSAVVGAVVLSKILQENTTWTK